VQASVTSTTVVVVLNSSSVRRRLQQGSVLLSRRTGRSGQADSARQANKADFKRPFGCTFRFWFIDRLPFISSQSNARPPTDQVQSHETKASLTSRHTLTASRPEGTDDDEEEEEEEELVMWKAKDRSFGNQT
jgi:hypothetical protein